MQIGNLSRTHNPYDQRDNVALQALRILLVVGLMAAGSLALWLSGGTSAPAGGMVTVAPPQILAGEPQLVELPQRSERVQVADADPAASMATPATEAVYVPASGTQEPVPSPMMANPPQLSSEQVSAGTTAEAAFNQTERSTAAPPADIDMTGTVQASLAEPARPGTPASDLVDLNRASFEQLNSLKGAGALGRAIIKGRPYKSVDDLVKKKVMRRTVFEKIKNQVKVQ